MKVVVVGGGFGGVKSALNLANKPGFDVKLISNHPYFEYHAALYRAATGRSPLEVAIPLKDFFPAANNIEVVEDQITGIDGSSKQLTAASGSRYSYDVLILAVGSVTQYFGIDGLAKYSYGVKSIHEALALKRHLHEELAQKSSGQANYVVVGGGASGVELAAELMPYIKRIRIRHQSAQRPFKVLLVEAAERLMPAMPPKFSAKILKRLQKLGVEVRLNTAVKGESFDTLALPGEDIQTHTVAWTAGIANNPLFEANPGLFKLGKGRRVVVDGQLAAAPNIYVIGDSADTPYSGMAQTAIDHADTVTANLISKTDQQPSRPYQPKPPISAIPVGPRWAAVIWNNKQFYGYPGWLIRRWLDYRLFRKFLPLPRALSELRQGSHLTESCPVCD